MATAPAASIAPAAAEGQHSAVARLRRDEIVRAASDIIAAEGLHRLSLARIEERAGMSRGQLTYYFPAKEDILLAVFDRMLQRMIESAIADARSRGLPESGPRVAWERLKQGLTHLLTPAAPGGPPPEGPDKLGPLVHTFLAQVSHRPDYRAKLAGANAAWRGHIAADLDQAHAAAPGPIGHEAVAAVICALFQGLRDQLAVDPDAFDRGQVLELCLQMLAPFVLPGVAHD